MMQEINGFLGTQSHPLASARTSMGRQKIEIKKIEEKTKLQVSFSKRRKGLFNKVAELGTLCGGAAAVLVHSPGGKLFSFGTPSTEHVINRYLGMSKGGDHCCSEKKKYEEVEEEFKKKKEEEEEEEEGGEFWWRRKNVEELGLEELEEMKKSLEGLKRKIEARREEMDLEMILEIPRVEFEVEDDDFWGFVHD